MRLGNRSYTQVKVEVSKGLGGGSQHVVCANRRIVERPLSCRFEKCSSATLLANCAEGRSVVDSPEQVDWGALDCIIFVSILASAEARLLLPACVRFNVW